ncbi:MAG TPA: urea carboxylase-associated family protein [Thermomicrobiales bacterium]|nr:urea carboxylase-associated family protein [Thermomicrobiales bacterium]
MANVLVGHRAVAAKQLAVGAAAAFTMEADQLLQIVDLQGKQVASLAAFAGDHNEERLSTPVTMTMNASLVLKTGSRLYSQRGTALFELVDDSVGRHDLLTSPLSTEADTASTVKSKVSTLDSLQAAAEEAGLENADVTDPVNLFKHVVIKQRGELDVRDSFSERNDVVVLRALTTTTVIVANAYSEKKPGLAASQPAGGKPGQLLVRVYR